MNKLKNFGRLCPHTVQAQTPVPIPLPRGNRQPTTNGNPTKGIDYE
jgi:hypothetical protein